MFWKFCQLIYWLTRNCFYSQMAAETVNCTNGKCWRQQSFFSYPLKYSFLSTLAVWDQQSVTQNKIPPAHGVVQYLSWWEFTIFPITLVNLNPGGDSCCYLCHQGNHDLQICLSCDERRTNDRSNAATYRFKVHNSNINIIM